MTLRKYKKLLMSYGFDRDQAEYDRKRLALFRRVAAEEGIGTFGTTSRRGCIKHRKEMLKNVIVV